MYELSEKELSSRTYNPEKGIHDLNKLDYPSLALELKALDYLGPGYLTEWYKDNVFYPCSDPGVEEGNTNWVYVFYNSSTGLSKIGITNNLKDRKKGIENTAGCEIHVLLGLALRENYDEPNGVVEKMLHTFFGNKRIRGEWFKLDLKDVLAIKNLFWAIEGDGIVENIKGDNPELYY